MSDETPQSPNDGFRASLAGLRRILLLDSPTAAMLKGPPADEMERARLKKELRIVKEDLQSYKTRVELLEQKAQESSDEAREAREARSTLEEISAALEKDKQDLTAQLQTVTVRSQALEEHVALLEDKNKTQQETHSQTASQLNHKLQQACQETENALQQSGVMEARHLASERKMQEMEKELEEAKRNLTTERSQLEGTVQSLERSNELLRKRVEAPDAAAEKSKKEVSIVLLED